MKILTHKQGSPEWIHARLGLPTASNFDRLITKTGKPSASADKYLAKLCAEWFLGCPLDDFQSGYMERGTGMEAEAVASYEFENNVDTTECGLCLRDDGKVGASPDRLVGEDGILEIKCPSAETHMGYILNGPPDEYRPQVQGQLWITGRMWCDLNCYHPTLPPVRVRIERDEEFIADLSKIVEAFVVKLEAAKARLSERKAEFDEKTNDLPAGIC